MATVQLQQQQEEQRRAQLRREAFEEQVMALTLKMQKLDLDEVDYKILLEIMGEGLELLGAMKKHWTNMKMFFASVSTRVGFLTDKMHDFVKNTRSIEKEKDAGRLYKESMKTLTGDVKDIYETGYSLHLVAKIYVRMSVRFVVPQLASLPRLLNNHKGFRDAKMHELDNNANAAIMSVRRLAAAQRATFDKTVKSEITRLVNEFGLQIDENRGKGFGRVDPLFPDDI